MKTLPKYFIILRDATNPLWDKYIQWLRDTYNSPWAGNFHNYYYGYDGNTTLDFSGTDCYRNVEHFNNNPTIITLDYWNECVNGFQLPEKWCIKVTSDNITVLTEWVKSQPNFNSIYLPVEQWVISKHPVDYSYQWYGKPNNFTEITFEQFKQYILKQDNMEKKLIGYKLSGKASAQEAANLLNCDSTIYPGGLFFKENQLDCSAIKRAEELGILDLWFEPVYEGGFKVGDWVTIKDSDKLQVGCQGCPKGVWQITNSKHSHGLSHDDVGFNVVVSSDEVWRISDKGVTKSTPEEIAKAVNPIPDIIIKGYKAEFTKTSVKFGCQTYTKEFVLTLAKCLEDNGFDMDIKDEILEIAEYFKSLD